MPEEVRAAVISLGTEITEGIIQDTHGRFLSSELTSLGIRVERISALRDGDEAAKSIESEIASYDLILITGGLGPTTDDITREAVASAAGVEIVYDENVWNSIETRYRLSTAKANRRQAQIPEGFHCIENDNGTAPGFWGEVKGSMVVALPGPPRELQPMFYSPVREEIIRFFGVEERETRELSTFLIPEAVLEDVCAELRPESVDWRTRFQPYKISLYLEGGSEAERSDFCAGLKARFGDELVQEGEVDAFALMSERARGSNKSIVAAESCTGGLFSTLVTNLPGSSELFWGSFVSYSNEAKQRSLGVSSEGLNRFGAVSQETAKMMAEGALKNSSADVAVAITGVAGPSGGTEGKPVGTVCFALTGGDFDTRSFTLGLGSRRVIVRRRSAVSAALMVDMALRSPESLDMVEKWNYS